MKSVSFIAARRQHIFNFLFALGALLLFAPNAQLLAQKSTVSAEKNPPPVKTESALDLGNPSNAKPDTLQPDNYLVTHATFSLSYNRTRGAANWVAWHLTRSDIGTLDRSNAFAPDTTLPKNWWIKPTDYTGSGYDRGHLCPSKDRSAVEEENRETFLMSNMQPQTPKLNQKTWKYLEDYTREIVKKETEAYVYAGCYGSLGKIKEKITIPARCFKIVVVLPEGANDLKRINKQTRIIAVDMPNDDTLSVRWRSYLTTVDEIERATGYDFLSSVPKKIQTVIEAAKDTESVANQKENDSNDTTAPAASTPSNTQTNTPTNTQINNSDRNNKTEPASRTYIRGPRGGCYYINENGKKIYVTDKSLCGN